MKKKNPEDKRISWDDLANIYDKTTGSHARTMPMDVILAWAESRKQEFYFDEEEYLCYRKGTKNEP